MAETFFEEMKRYVGFGADDEAALRQLHPRAAPHFRRIADEFYERLSRHPEAARVISGPEQLGRLKGSLGDWMDLLLTGPWDDAYYEKRALIGRMHVRISLPQRYMFGAMNAIRISLSEVARDAFPDDGGRRHGTVSALEKIIDLELAIMLETHRESFVDRVQQLERLEKTLLERRLALSEARYAEIVETAGAFVVTFDADGRIQFSNQKMRQECGEDLRGQDWFERFVAAERRLALHEDCRRLLDEGASVAPFESPAVCRGAERRVRWYVASLPTHGLRLLSAVGIDVTEEHALANRTRRAERLASLGTMAAGLAHEIRNPLNAAHLQLTLLLRRLGRLPGDVTSATEAAQLAAGEMKRLASLVEEFLQFARPQPLRIARGDLFASAENVVALVTPHARARGVALELLPGGQLAIEMDEERMKQVLHNLISNAVEASPPGGLVRVRVGSRGGEAVLDVEDQGEGIDPPDAPIFEPFYTNKPEGTGLGLAIVLRIVTDHGGRIDVDTRPGHTLFTVVIPASQGPHELRVG